MKTRPEIRSPKLKTNFLLAGLMIAMSHLSTVARAEVPEVAEEA